MKKLIFYGLLIVIGLNFNLQAQDTHTIANSEKLEDMSIEELRSLKQDLKDYRNNLVRKVDTTASDPQSMKSLNQVFGQVNGRILNIDRVLRSKIEQESEKRKQESPNLMPEAVKSMRSAIDEAENVSNICKKISSQIADALVSESLGDSHERALASMSIIVENKFRLASQKMNANALFQLVSELVPNQRELNGCPQFQTKLTDKLHTEEQKLVALTAQAKAVCNSFSTTIIPPQSGSRRAPLKDHGATDPEKK